MDVDDFLSSTDLPDVAVNPDDALERTTRRGRTRRQRRAAATGVASLLVVVGLVAVTLNLAGREEPVDVATAPSIPATPPHDPQPGDDAVWGIDRDEPPSSAASTFTALVRRLGCNGGATGRVLRPGVVLSDTEVVITFTVEADPDGGECPTNSPVPYEVDLGQALGDRILIDGSCQPGGPAEGTSSCENGAVRSSPAASSAPRAEPHECEAEEGSVIDVAHEPDWRAYAGYLPWTDADGCLLRIDALAERPGPEHCGWEGARVLIVGQPLGTLYTTPADTTEFVRDPDGVFDRPDLTAGFEPNATLPDDAVDSGFRRDDLAVFHTPGDQSAIWLVSPGGVERWPAGDTPLCL